MTSVNFNNEEVNWKRTPGARQALALHFFVQLTHVRAGVGSDHLHLSDMLSTW